MLEQAASLVDDLKKLGADSPPPVPWEQIKRYDGRFDVLHFEQIAEEADDESDEDEMLDPSALLVVLAALGQAHRRRGHRPPGGNFFI